MNQTSLFHTRDDLNAPSSCRVHPLEKGLGVARIAQRAGCDYSHGVRDNLLRRAMKAAKHLHRRCHRVRAQKASSEDALAESGHFAVFMERTQTTALKACNLEPNRVGADIDRGEGGHRTLTVYMHAASLCIEGLG